MVLSLTELGSSPTIPFELSQAYATTSPIEPSPNYASTALSLPVPRGLAPLEIRGKIEFPVKIRYGNLTVRQGNRTIGRIDLPLEDQADVVLPLVGASVVNDSLNLNVSLTALPPDGFSWSSSANLLNSSMVFTGDEQVPTTVGDFLPAVLRRVTIALPANPSKSESEAAVQLAAAVAGYKSQNPEVLIVPLPEGAMTLPGQPPPLERRIVIKESNAKGVSLRGDPGSQSLLVSGIGQDLSDQARMFNNEWAQFAISANVAAETLPEDRESLDDDTTLGQMNRNGLFSQRLQPEVVMYVDQTRFGHPVGGMRVHLIGSHTPVPNSLGGEVVVSVDGQSVDRWPADATGTIDRHVEIPVDLIKRVTKIAVTVLTGAGSGNDDDRPRTALRLNPETSIQVNPSMPFATEGFQSFPQALSTHVHIGIGADAFGDTARAAQIAVGLRRISRLPLVIDVIGLKEAIDSRDSVVLVSGTQPLVDSRIQLPLTENQSGITVNGIDAKGQSLTLKLEPTTPFGSLQTARSGDRSILVATSNGAPGRLDDLLKWLGSQPGRWAGLDGRAILSVANRDPLTVPNPPSDRAALPATDFWSGREWLKWSLAGAVLTTAAVVVVALRRRR